MYAAHDAFRRDLERLAHPRGAPSRVNLYAAMPSLHVAWAAGCALAGLGLLTASWPGRRLADGRRVSGSR
jgi:hypothetical protein